MIFSRHKFNGYNAKQECFDKTVKNSFFLNRRCLFHFQIGKDNFVGGPGACTIKVLQIPKLQTP
jgi:hypothetical protein